MSEGISPRTEVSGGRAFTRAGRRASTQATQATQRGEPQPMRGASATPHLPRATSPALAAAARPTHGLGATATPGALLLPEELTDLAERVASQTTLTLEQARRGVEGAFAVLESRTAVETMVREFIMACRI